MILRFDPADATVGDLEDFAEVTGMELPEAMRRYPVLDDSGHPVLDDKGKPRVDVRMTAKTIKALVWLVMRRDDPAFTLDDARKVRLSELQLGSEPDPKETPPDSAG